MRRLFFDVSTILMYVGISKDDEITDFSIRVSRQDHAKYLVDRIENLLKRNDLELRDIDEMIVGVGPGSYTGIRIAVMVAKMLGYTKNIPVKTVSSLYFLTSGFNEPVVSMIDARRGYVFAMIHHGEEIILDDQYIELSALAKHPHYKQAKGVFIDDDHYKVDINRLVKHAKRVENIHDLVPNYLRKTEAESTLNS